MRFNDLTERQKRQFAKMYEEANVYSIADISARFGIGHARVIDWAKSLNLKIRAGGRAKKKKKQT
jgi:hypothetical protein